MEVESCLVVVGLVHCLLYILDAAARAWFPLQYLHLNGTIGLEVSLMQVRWSTNRFNRSLRRFGGSCPGFLSAWFQVGAVVASLLIIPAVYILVSTLVDSLTKDEKEDRVVIQPVLPGVNIPNADLGYYFISLLVCSVYHELGHALCAVSERVGVLGVGVFLLFIIPAAYVDLPTDQLSAKSGLQRLRVFSGGVWHNLVLAVACYLVVLCLPWLAAPLYHHGPGLCVVDVISNSSVIGPSGLRPGDMILSVTGSSIENVDDLRRSILSSMESPNPGFCASPTLLSKLRTSGVTPGSSYDCCPLTSSHSLCFQVGGSETQCLDVRGLLSTYTASCSALAPCQEPQDKCAQPIFASNATKFVQIKRKDSKDFLFVGNPALVYTSIKTSKFCPKYGFVPLVLPEVVIKLCNYIVSFSSALAVLNVVPSLMLDGQHMMNVILELLLTGRFSKYRERIQFTLILLGTSLVVANVGVGFYTLAKRGASEFI